MSDMVDFQCSVVYNRLYNRGGSMLVTIQFAPEDVASLYISIGGLLGGI